MFILVFRYTEIKVNECILCILYLIDIIVHDFWYLKRMCHSPVSIFTNSM